MPSHWRVCCMYVCMCVCVCFCRYTGTTPTPPPGSHYTSPSETMWNTGGAYSMSQGMAVSGKYTHIENTKRAVEAHCMGAHQGIKKAPRQTHTHTDRRRNCVRFCSVERTQMHPDDRDHKALTSLRQSSSEFSRTTPAIDQHRS